MFATHNLVSALQVVICEFIFCCLIDNFSGSRWYDQTMKFSTPRKVYVTKEVTSKYQNHAIK